MAYEKHNWTTGEVITEELLDHMEEGIESNSKLLQYIKFTFDEGSLTTDSNLTGSDIASLISSGVNVVGVLDNWGANGGKTYALNMFPHVLVSSTNRYVFEFDFLYLEKTGKAILYVKVFVDDEDASRITYEYGYTQNRQ